MHNLDTPPSQPLSKVQPISSYSSANSLGLFLIAGFSAASIVGISLSQVASLPVSIIGALVAAIWAIWPFYQWDCLVHDRFLHPQLRRYNLPLKPAFGKVRDLLNNTTFHLRDRWHVTTCNTATRHIVASMSFSSDMGERKKPSHNLVEMELQFESDCDGTCSIKYDFRADSEWTYADCESVIHETLYAIELALGGGVIVGDIKPLPPIPAPSWYLIGATAAYAAWIVFDLLSGALL